MPNIKSAIKQMRQNTKRHARNARTKRAVKTTIRALSDALAKNDKAATERYQAAQAQIDKAAKHGVMHKNKAARKKAQLAKQLNQAIGAAKVAKKATPTKKAAPTPKATAKKPTSKTSKTASKTDK